MTTEQQQPGPADVRAIIAALGWTQPRAAEFLGVSVETVQRWLREPKPEGRATKAAKANRSKNSAPIPHACWRLLLIAAGRDPEYTRRKRAK